MVALVRAGVTATCSSADSPATATWRSTPTFRMRGSRSAGPTRTPSPPPCWPRRTPRTPTSSSGSCTTSGSARVWVPAAAPLATSMAARCGPARCADAAGARSSRAATTSTTAVASVVEDLADAEISVEPAAAVGHRAVRRANRRGAQPRGAQLRRRHRRHPAHVADAIVYRLAVRRVDGPAAAPHRARRLELPTAALDPHLRLRRGHRRRRLAIGRRSRPQRGVLAPAAGRRRKQQCHRWIAQLGLASGDRACGGRPARRAEGGGQPAGIRQQQAGRPRPKRWRLRLVETAGAATDVAITSGLHRVSDRRRASTCSSSRACRSTAHSRTSDAARLRDRHRADPAQHAACARRRPHPAGARGRGGAAAVCAVLAAQPRPCAARRTARSRAPAPAGHRRRCGRRSRAPAHRGQRLHRLGAARHGANGVSRRLEGQPVEPAVRAARAASIWKPTSS